MITAGQSADGSALASAPPDGAAVSNLRIGNHTGSLMKDRQRLAQLFGGKQFGVSR
jgi:hypothetical protein